MSEPETPKTNDVQGVAVAPPVSTYQRKYPYIAIFIGIVFVFIILLAVSQQLQKTPEIANTAIAPTVTQTSVFISSPTPIPTSTSLTVTPPRPQYTPLPTPPHNSSGSYINFVPDQAYIDSLPQIESSDEYPNKELIPSTDEFRYVANVINKNAGFSVVLSLPYINNEIFSCTNPTEDIALCGYRLIQRITLSKDNPFSVDDPVKWLRLLDEQKSHVTSELVKVTGTTNEYIIKSDTYNKGPTKDKISLWELEGKIYTSFEGSLKQDVPWKYISLLGFGCQYSCPSTARVFVNTTDPNTVFVVGHTQNGPFTQDITGRSFDYVDTFRILPKETN